MKTCFQWQAVSARNFACARRSNPSSRFALVLWMATLVVAGIVQSAHAQDADTGEPPQAQVVIENRTDFPIDLIEYDAADGSYIPYAELLQGDTFTETVGPGVVWFFRVNNEALIGQYTTTSASEQWVVLDASTLTDAGYSPQDAGEEVSSTDLRSAE